MITTTLAGGLGNNLFQVAAAIGTADSLDTDWCVTPSWEYGYYLQGPIYYDNYLLPKYSETGFNYKPIQQDNITLSGYWQSEKYFKHCEKEIRDIFKPNNEIEDHIQESYSDLLKENTCAIHVRRGDYLNLPDYHTNITLDYYQEALSVVGDKTFVCFSDDIDWCKNNILIADHYISEGDGSRQYGDVLDFFIMSKMDDFIISNSSFSWWASYLGTHPDKEIVAPRNWFGEKKQLDTRDLYTDKMIVI